MTTIIIIILILSGFKILALYFKSPENASQSENISSTKREYTEEEQIEYYYSNIYNSLILFANSVDYLKNLSAPAFDPLFELYDEFYIGFDEYNLSVNVKNKKITEDLKSELMGFKLKIETIPNEFWTYEEIENNTIWSAVRHEANVLLDKMGVKSREYNQDFTTIYYVDK